MKIEIKPSCIRGSIKAPASKSMAHRFLICAGLSEGESEIRNIAYSEDILATLDCLEALGAKVVRCKDSVKIKGVSPDSLKGGIFNCRESGSTLRFFIPLAMLCKEKSLFKGSGRLMERPMELYERLCEEKGLFYKKSEEGITVSGFLHGGSFRMRGDISSQFITGLLFALPLCKEDSRITLTGKAESLSYIDMTIEAQRRFGVVVEKEENNTFYIRGSQSYKPQQLAVEGDYSNAAFLEALNYLRADIAITGLSSESKQGDRIYRSYFPQIKESAPLLDVTDCPDLAPVLMTLASALNGATLTGTRRLKIKESDRAQVMAEELSKFGAIIRVDENEVEINKSVLHKPEEELNGHNDHRVVMSLAVLASVFGGIIDGAEAVKKSYPDFFERMMELGMEVIEYGDK